MDLSKLIRYSTMFDFEELPTDISFEIHKFVFDDEYIIKELCRLYTGRLSVSSDYGKGMFALYLNRPYLGGLCIDKDTDCDLFQYVLKKHPEEVTDLYITKDTSMKILHDLSDTDDIPEEIIPRFLVNIRDYNERVGRVIGERRWYTDDIVCMICRMIRNRRANGTNSGVINATI